jgi:hypothetical protein
MGDSHLRRGWSVERSSGNANAPWQIIHIATGLPVPVLRPYPGVEKLPVLTVGSLFAGIGGFDLGLERAGMRCVWQCEIDPYCPASS